MRLAGKPMVAWSVEAFRAAESVGAIVVACPPGYRDGGKGPAALEGGSPAASEGKGPVALGGDPLAGLEGEGLTIVDGGEERAESVANALAAVETELVAIHDAARPLLTPELIEAVVATLCADPDAAGAIAAAPVADTIKRVGAKAAAGPAPTDPSASFDPYGALNSPAVVEETLDRSRLWGAQTPQVFRAAALREALAADPERIAAATDEAMLVEAAGGRVLIHPSSPENLKVTTPLDLKLAELLLSL